MTVIATGLNTEFTGNFAVSQGRAYYTNDFDAVKEWDGVDSAMRDAGIAKPASAPTAPTSAAGVVTAGKHLVRYRYFDSRKLYVSNPSNVSALLADGSSSYVLTAGTNMALSLDPKVDQIIVEMTPVNSGVYYEVGTCLNVNAQTLTINLTDEVLIQGSNVSETYGDFGQELPPLARCVCEHAGRLFLGGSTTRTRTVTAANASTSVTGTGFSTGWAGRRIKIGSDSKSYEIATATSTTLTLATAYTGSTASYSAIIYSPTPNRIYWSKSLYPEGFRPAFESRDMLQNRSDELRGLMSYNGDVWIFGRHSCERLVYTSDPGVAEGQIIPVPGDRGVHNQRCLVQVEGAVYVWDRAGVYRLAGGTPQHISKPIDEKLEDDVNFNFSEKFHGVFDPIDRVVMFFYVQQGDTEPKSAACFDIDTGRWFFSQWLQPVTASCVAPDSNGQVRALLGDYNGYTWFHGYNGPADGVPSAWPTVVTVASGSTSTVINTVESLPTDQTVVGSQLYSGGIGYMIQSSTASSITLATGLSGGAPVDGTKLSIGVIPWEYELKWNKSESLASEKRPRYLFVSFIPGDYDIDVYFYADLSDNVITPTAFSSDVWPKGASIVSDHVSIDASIPEGCCAVPLPADWHRSIKAKLAIYGSTGEPRILDINWWNEETKEPEA